MYTDYWRQFEKTGSVQDYLNYRNSVADSVKNENNGKSEWYIDKDTNTTTRRRRRKRRNND